jgi:hypothetical protein
MPGYRGSSGRVSSLDGIVGYLRQVVDHLERAITDVRVGQSMAEGNRDQCRRLGAHGLAGSFTGIIDGAERLEALLLGGISQVRDLIAQVEAIRGAGTGRPHPFWGRALHLARQ